MSHLAGGVETADGKFAAPVMPTVNAFRTWSSTTSLMQVNMPQENPDAFAAAVEGLHVKLTT